jgi:hypothetical protein
MKPPLASTVLRKNAPREIVGQTFEHRNRYEKLRENSPASSYRSRLDSNASQKRKVCDEDDITVSSQREKVCRIDPQEEEEIAKLESKISKVSTMCGKMLTSVQQLDIDDPLRVILADLIETVRITNEVQEELHSKQRKSREQAVAAAVGKESEIFSIWDRSDFPPPPTQQQKTVRNDNRKKPAGGLVSMSLDGRGRNPQIQVHKPAETEEEKKHRKFSEAIKDAERSTLCFNLDMGNTPIMNKNSISEKACLALARMAAAVEGKKGPVPSQDKIEALDDIASLVTNMEFYGSNTKSYTSKGKEVGKDAGKEAVSFCTVPVKYQFKDRETKTFAEKTLRETCKVKCSTPYPAIVRECIKQVVDHVRLSHPQDYVRVSVVPKEFSLKVSRRPPGKDLPWFHYPDLLRLPNEALDIHVRKVPDGLRMFFLPSEPQEQMSIGSPIKSPKSASPGKASGEKK